MKWLWNYLFYYSWKLHIWFAHNMLEKPLDSLFRLNSRLDKHNKKSKSTYKQLINDQEVGANILFSYRWMLLITSMILVGLQLCIIDLFDLNLAQLCAQYFNIQLGKGFNSTIFFISFSLLSIIWNEILLGWNKSRYLNYFAQFSQQESKLGYVGTILFHLSAIIFCVLTMLTSLR